MNKQNVPALLKHSYSAYDLLASLAEPVALDEDNEVLMYTGSVTSTLLNIEGINTGNYSMVMNALKVMGCIDQIVKGGGRTKSTIKLNYPPDLTKFLATRETKKHGRAKDRAVQQQVSDIVERLTRVEAENRKLLRRIEVLEAKP